MSTKNDNTAQTMTTTATGKPRSSRRQRPDVSDVRTASRRERPSTEMAVAATIALLPTRLYQEACRRYPEPVVRLANKWRVRITRSNGKYEAKLRGRLAEWSAVSLSRAELRNAVARQTWALNGRSIFRDKDGCVYLIDDNGIRLRRGPKRGWVTPKENWGGRYRRRGAIFRFGWAASPSIAPKEVRDER